MILCLPLDLDGDSRSKKRSTDTITDESSDTAAADLQQCGQDTLPNGTVIDRNSAGFLPHSKKDTDEEDEYGYTLMKIRRKYAKFSHQPDGSRGTLLYVCLNKGTNGLGISLAGHKDRSKMAVYVCGLRPQGNAYRDGRIKMGDLILEVNGKVLHDRHHLNVTSVIKALPDADVTFVLLRTDSGAENLAVRPLTHFPAEPFKDNPIERYRGKYRGLREVSIQKTEGSGLGIMIIEGKHPEAGTGVFVSDLQAGSCADLAGLKRGDMILAVNGEDFVGVNYDTAASVLKTSEGTIKMIVANPLFTEVSAPALEAGPPAPAVSSKAEKVESGSNQRVAPTVASPEKPKLPPKPAIAPKPGVATTTAPTTTTSTAVVAKTTAVTTTASTTVSTSATSTAAADAATTSTKPAAATTAAPKGTNTAPAKPATRRPVASPRKGGAQNPARCEIVPGADTTIEITKDKDEDGKTMGLGLSIVGGSDTLLGAIFIHEVYEKGAAHKDGRLRPGDQVQ